MSQPRSVSAERTVSTRVAAPIDWVWSEVGSLAGVLERAPGVRDYRASEDGRTAELVAAVAFGPIHWDVECELEVVDEEPPRRLEFRGFAPRFQLDFRGVVDLGPTGHDETMLTYEFAVSMPRRSLLHERVWRVISEVFELHVAGFSSRAARLAEQHALAQRALGDDRARPS